MIKTYNAVGRRLARLTFLVAFLPISAKSRELWSESAYIYKTFETVHQDGNTLQDPLPLSDGVSYTVADDLAANHSDGILFSFGITSSSAALYLTA
jgi:hypothetical protein